MYHYLPTGMDEIKKIEIKKIENAVCYQKCGSTENSDKLLWETH